MSGFLVTAQVLAALSGCAEPDVTNSCESSDNPSLEPIVDVPVNLHVVSSSQGQNKIFSKDWPLSFDKAASYYEDAVNHLAAGCSYEGRYPEAVDAGYRIFINDIDSIVDDAWASFTYNEEDLAQDPDLIDFAKDFSEDGVVSIFIFENIDGGAAGFYHKAGNFIGLAGLSCDTFAGCARFSIHELGHYFGLNHTFQDFQSEWEAMQRTGASSAEVSAACSLYGDKLCDTPPDPGFVLCPVVPSDSVEDISVACKPPYESLNEQINDFNLYFAMSYYTYALSFTPEQGEVMALELESFANQ